MSGANYSRPSVAEMRRGEAATWGTPAADTGGARKAMALLSWKSMIKGALRGFASVELPCGLKIHDIPVLVGRNGPWASLPSKPLIGPDGQHKRDPNGKPAYVPILQWRDRDLSDRFSAAVVELVQTAAPGALDDAGAP